MANPAFGAPKPKPAVIVEEPKAAVTPPTAPLPEPPVSAEIEPEPVVAPAPKPKKPAAPAVPAAVTPPVAPVSSAAELLRESSTVNVIEPPKPKPAPKPSAASPMVETLATADYTDPMQAFADSIQVPLPTMRKRLLEFNADPENAGLPEDEWNRRAVDSLIRISPRYDELSAEPPKPPPLPTYGFAQTDGFVLWSAMRAEYEKEKYHGEKAKPPAQILIEYAQARGMKPAELAEAAKAAGTDLFAIQRVAREDRSKAESLAEFNRLRLGGRYTTPEKARQARVAEAVTKPPKEEDRSSLTVVMSNDIPFFAPLPDEDPELTHTAAGMRYAQDVIDHIPPSRNVIYETGFQQYASDSRQVFLEAADDILAHGVSFEVKGIIDGKPGKKVIRLTSNSAAAALQAMKDNGFDVSGPDAMKAAAAVGNEAKRRAVARAVNEVAAKQINGHFASPVRASIPFSQMTNLAPPGGYDPLSDDRDTMWLNTDAVDDARSMVQRGDYLGAASQALAPTLTIAGYADIPGSSAVWPVLVREESRFETAADWTDIPYAAGKGALEPVTDAWERGDYAEAAANLTLAGFGRVENGRIVARSPDEILAGVAAAVEHRENSFADLQESDILTKYIETANYGLNLARKMDFGLPDRFDIDYNGDGKIDATDRERGWTEYQDFMTFGLQNLAAFGGAVATLDMFDVLGAMQAGKVIRRLNRAIEYKPAAVNLMDEAKKALVKGDFEAAQKAEEQLEFRPGHSREKAGPARAHPEGQAPILGQTSRVVDSVLAHEAHELGKADEMFDTAIEGALPDIDPVVTSGPTPSNRRFYLHGSVRTSAKQYLTTEDLRARYAFRHFYNIVESMEAAIADGRATYKTRLLRKFAKPIKEFVTQTGLTGDAADALRKLLRQNVASGYSPMQIDAVLRAHLKGDAYDLANKAATELAAAVAKEEADAVKEGRIAVERARRAVDQQVASRIASMQRTIDFVRGPEPGTAFGKWLHEKLPAVRNWFSRFREPENLVKVVESEVLQRATTVETPVDIPATVKRLDTEEQAIRARTLEVEAAQIAKDEAAEKKAKKLLKAATTRRNNVVKSIAAAINGRGHVLSDAGIEHFLRMRAADGGATDPAEIMFTTILIDLRAEKMVEDGTAKTLEEVHERFSWRRSDTVEPDALLQDDVDETLSEAGRVGVKTNQEAIVRLLGSRMYAGSILATAQKELLQNAFDGVKAAQHRGLVDVGRIHIRVDPAERTVEIIDNGVGMSPETVTDGFYTVGGTDKRDLPLSERSGGLGLAKVQFMENTEIIELETVRDGVRTIVRSTPDEVLPSGATVPMRTGKAPAAKKDVLPPLRSVIDEVTEDARRGAYGAARDRVYATAGVNEYADGDRLYVALRETAEEMLRDTEDMPLPSHVKSAFRRILDSSKYDVSYEYGDWYRLVGDDAAGQKARQYLDDLMLALNRGSDLPPEQAKAAALRLIARHKDVLSRVPPRPPPPPDIGEIGHGTRVKVKIPETRVRGNGETENVPFRYTDSPLEAPILGNVIVTHEVVGKGTEILRHGVYADIPPKVGTVDFPWGTVDVYARPSKDTWSRKQVVLSAGVFQFHHRLKATPQKDLPFDVVMDVRPKVEAQSETYPISNEREGFSKKAAADIAALETMLAERYNSANAHQAIAAYAFVRGVDNDTIAAAARGDSSAVEDFRAVLAPRQGAAADTVINPFDKQKPFALKVEGGRIVSGNEDVTGAVETATSDFVSHAESLKGKTAAFNNTDFDLAALPPAVTAAVARLSAELNAIFFAPGMRDAVKRVGEAVSWKGTTDDFVVGVGFDREWHGINVGKRDAKSPELILFNPATLPQSLQNASPRQQARSLVLLVLHEATHTTAGGHDATFAGAMGDIIALYEDMAPAVRAVERVLTDNAESFKILREEFASAKNIGQKLEAGEESAVLGRSAGDAGDVGRRGRDTGRSEDGREPATSSLYSAEDVTRILRQDETPDFIEPERLSRRPRVVRGESGEMSVAALSKGTAAEMNKMLLAFENATYIDPGSLSQARQLITKAAGGRVSAAVYDNLREVVDDIVGDAAARLGDEVEFWERRWNVLRGQVTTGPTEPLAILPPQKVPTDPVEMTRVVRDTPWFHGAVRGEVQLREYDPAKHAGKSAGLMFGPGIYLAENPEIAISYATHTGLSVGTAPGKAALKTVMVSPERLLDIRLSAFDAYGESQVGDAWAAGDYTYGHWIVDQLLARGVPEEVAAEFSSAREPADVGSILNELRILPAVDFDAVADMLRAKRPDLSDADVRWLIAANAVSRSSNLRASEDVLREYFRPGRMVPSYAGVDEVVEYLGSGHVRVRGADGSIREHMTYPDHRDVSRYIAREYGDVSNDLPSDIPILPAEIIDHLDGLFHVGRKDGNVLVLFDPNGKIGGRSIINVESRVLPERVVYQTDDLAAAKAYVQFEADGKALVTLLKKADASSFIHETAHVFRRTLDETDNATVLRWTKASGLDVELQNGIFVGPDAVKAEEMFARAFERFALEGKTTAKGLRRLFTNLRDVMLRIYRGGKALDVEISPEMEILFNRMISPKSVATEVAPTIHTGATDMSAAKWLAGRSNGLLKPDELLAALEAGETVRLPFRVFGKDEIDINDLARLQVQIDTIAGSPEPVFKEPFKSARQQVVEPTLTGDIQSALSQDAPEGSIEKVGFHLTRGSAAVVLGADAMAQDRIFAPRFRELSQQGGRLLDQRVGDMNVFLREQEIDDGRVPVIRYMTGQAQNFRVGGRTPLSSGHDAVAEVGEIIEESAAELAQIKIQVSNAIDEAYENSTGVAQYVGPGGQITGNAAAAAPLGQLSQEVAVIARRVTDLPTAGQRSNEVSAFFGGRPDRQRMVRGVVKALMTNGNVDTASATIFRHLGMALLNNGIMEGKSVDEVIRTAQVPKLLAYVDAMYRLGGFEVVDDMLVQNSRTSAERLQDFIQVLDNAGFGPEGIDRALVVVNAFGAQKSIFAHVSDFGAAFSKEEYAAFNRFLNGDFKSAADYANGLRMFKQFGFNHDALEEAAGLIEGSKSRYIPANVQKRIGSALGRALDETTDQKNSQTPEAARWLLSFWQRQVVRGTLLPKAAKAWMDNMDTFFMTAAVGGVEVGARAAMRQGLQTLFIGTRGHLLGWLTRTIDQHGSATDRIRSGLQNFGDWMASPTGQQTVNKILKGSDEIYRTADGRVYRHSDFLTAAIRHGTVSSFETSVLRESIRRSREATFIADEVPTTVAGRMYDLARERASQASHGVKNTLTDILHANSELFEAWAERERMGVMVTFAEAGMTPDKAARKTVEALFDYPGSLAASELKGTFSGFMLTLVQPFWPFVKNANHFAINAIEKPEILYRLTAMRRAIEYGQEAVAQTIYSFFVDPYGFDYAEMSPESRASYYMLRDAYEKSLGKLPHEMTVEERLKLAAIILSAQPESPFAVADGKHFRLPGGVSDITATEISRLPGGNAIASSYRPEPRLENVPPYMQRRIRTLFPARRTGAIESYIRATQQQDLQYAVAAFEPAPISGMNYLANTLALYGYVGAVMTTEQSASAEQSLRAIREFADPERMPLVSDIAAAFQVRQPERVSYALAAAMQQHPDLASWVYPVYDERTIPMTEYELSLGVDPDAAGVRKPVRWYTVNPTLSLLLRTVLYDTNTTALNMQQPGGAFARETNLEALRKVLYLVGPLKITEESQSRAASRAYYDLPPDARPR